MSAREMGIGIADRDLRSGLAMFLSRILHQCTRRALGTRHRETHRLNKLAEEYGVNEIVLAFIAFMKGYGRRANDPYKLFLRNFDSYWRDGFSRAVADELKMKGRLAENLDLATINEWILCQLEDHGLLPYVHLVADRPRWGRGAAELDAGMGALLVGRLQAEPAVLAERVA